MKAKKPLAILAIQAAGLVLFGLSDSDISIANTSNSNNEVASNSSAGATITKINVPFPRGDQWASDINTGDLNDPT